MQKFYRKKVFCKWLNNYGLVAGCGNRHLQLLYDKFPVLLVTICYGRLPPSLSMRHTHEHIAQALVTGRAVEAERAVRLHIREAVQSLIRCGYFHERKNHA